MKKIIKFIISILTVFCICSSCIVPTEAKVSVEYMYGSKIVTTKTIYATCDSTNPAYLTELISKSSSGYEVSFIPPYLGVNIVPTNVDGIRTVVADGVIQQKYKQNGYYLTNTWKNVSTNSNAVRMYF